MFFFFIAIFGITVKVVYFTQKHNWLSTDGYFVVFFAFNCYSVILEYYTWTKIKRYLSIELTRSVLTWSLAKNSHCESVSFSESFCFFCDKNWKLLSYHCEICMKIRNNKCKNKETVYLHERLLTVSIELNLITGQMKKKSHKKKQLSHKM